MNIRLDYLYRDAGNFKNWNSVVFSNPNARTREEVAGLANGGLIDGINFPAGNVGLPDLHFRDYDDELDHGWHEVGSFNETTDAPDDPQERTIDEFLGELQIATEQIRRALA